MCLAPVLVPLSGAWDTAPQATLELPGRSVSGCCLIPLCRQNLRSRAQTGARGISAFDARRASSRPPLFGCQPSLLFVFLLLLAGPFLLTLLKCRSRFFRHSFSRFSVPYYRARMSAPGCRSSTLYLDRQRLLVDWQSLRRLPHHHQSRRLRRRSARAP